MFFRPPGFDFLNELNRRTGDFDGSVLFEKRKFRDSLNSLIRLNKMDGRA